MAKVKIRQVKSNIKSNYHQRRTLQALGLGKVGSSVEREDGPQLQGQIRVVSHLVEIESA